MYCRKWFTILVSLLSCAMAHAQTINLYSRMTDPRGIARLSVPDSLPTKSVNFHGDASWNLDPVDGIPDVARDTGSGVITHLWSACGDPDSTVTLWLYIDDTLVLTGTYDQFFGALHGLFRPPLDTSAHGAGTCDVQIPYHHGFRLAMITTKGNVYWAVEWHWVPEAILPWFSATAPISSMQQNAESDFMAASVPWNDSGAVTISAIETLASHSAQTVADLVGPGMIRELQFIPGTYDRNALDSTWLNVYWDGSPTPSVHVPLLDFFLCPVNVNLLSALHIHVSEDSGFLCYFPMPFFVRARVELVRTASTPLFISASVQYHSEPVDRNSDGYFHADFSESNPTRYHVWHPVIHTVGRGRYVGFGWGVMQHPFTVFLEGNPRFQIDSNVNNFIEFTGAEDYFDAAWWFRDGMFSVPFAGFTDYIDAFYRFQYMDAYEFTKSFDFDMQPGNAEDVYDHFRTVGYYYLHWTPFWASRDTAVTGERWSVSGSGYVPQEPIQIALGPESLSTVADDSGYFTLSTMVPNWTPGVYHLTVNGEPSPKEMIVLNAPAIRPFVDTLPITLRAGDSLVVTGTGFQPGESVSFYLDSIPLHQSAVADSNNAVNVKLRMPYVAEHAYYLVARGSLSGNATAQDFVSITRAIDLEFEDLMPPSAQTPANCYAEDVSYFWEATWSKQMYVYFKPDSDAVLGATLEFQFSMAHPDTFSMVYHASVSPDQGRYAVLLDGDSIATLDCCQTTGSWNPLPLPSGPIPLGIHYLSEGNHKLRFVCLGKDDTATNDWIEPDNLVLLPTTYMAPTPGTILSTVTPIPPAVTSNVELYPNPSSGGQLHVTLMVNDPRMNSARVIVRVFDAIGRTLLYEPLGMLMGESYSGTISAPANPGSYFLQFEVVGSGGSSYFLPIQPLILK